MAHALGLRGKSVLALFATCVLVLLLASAVGWQAIKAMRSQLGAAFARNLTLLNRERILAPVSRELALSLRLAGSHITRRWFLDEHNEEIKALALQEAEGYRLDFKDKSYFLVPALSGNYYFNDTKSAPSTAPRYQLKADDPHDAWFFNTMKSDKPFNINVDPDVKLGLTKVWFNVIVKDGERKIGLGGTGLDLSTFLRDFASTTEPGVTPMILDTNGAIQAHPDSTHIAFNSGTEAASRDKSLHGLLENATDVGAADTALATASRS